MTIPRTTPIERDPQRLQEVLPWYLNGTLTEEDRVWVDFPQVRPMFASGPRNGCS